LSGDPPAYRRSQCLDDRTRQIATVAAFAALGESDTLAIHTRYALNVGVSADELSELVALTIVHAGFPKAIRAAQTTGAVIDEHTSAASSAESNDDEDAGDVGASHRRLSRSKSSPPGA